MHGFPQGRGLGVVDFDAKTLAVDLREDVEFRAGVCSSAIIRVSVVFPTCRGPSNDSTEFRFRPMRISSS